MASTARRDGGRRGARDASAAAQRRDARERLLDEALDETFPASDPIAPFTNAVNRARLGRRTPPAPKCGPRRA